MLRPLSHSVLLVLSIVFALTLGDGIASAAASKAGGNLVEIKDDELQIGCGVESYTLSQNPTDFDIFCTSVMPGVQRRIQHAWLKVAPREAYTLQEERKVTITFKLMNDGSVEGETLTHSSGIKALDRAAEQTIVAAEPYPVFPPQLQSKSMIVSYTFTYDGPMDRASLPRDLVIWEEQHPDKPGLSIGMLLLANELTYAQWQRVNREYLPELRRKLASAWKAKFPVVAQEDRQKSISEAELTIYADGTIGALRWKTRSGNELVDDAATKVLQESLPYEEFPDWCKRTSLMLKIYFLYQVSSSEVW